MKTTDYSIKEWNQVYTNNVIINPDQLICKCGKEANIFHSSNWHDGRGVFYVQCDCGKQWNVSWKSKNYNFR